MFFFLLFSCFCHLLHIFCYRLIAIGSCVVDGFRVSGLYGKIRSDRVIRSNHVCQYAIDMRSWVFQTYFDYQICRFRVDLFCY